MSKYDEFDLDIQTVTGENDVEPSSATLGPVCTFSFNYCTELPTLLSCDYTNCGCGTNQGCSGSTCSACRSYCGSSCR